MKPLANALCLLIEKALNAYLGLDRERAAAMDKLAGKTLVVEITDLDLCFAIDVATEQLKVRGYQATTNSDTSSDAIITTISGSSLALFQLGIQADNTKSLFRGDVKISGDLQSGQQFSEILRSIEVDWEELLSNYTGDVIAHQLGAGIRSLASWGKRAVDSLSQDLADYLKEESRQLPHPEEVESFIKSVGSLRLAVDRLEARVQRLQAHKNNNKQ